MEDVLFEVLIKDKRNTEDLIIGALSLSLKNCIEKPNYWAVNGAAELVLDDDAEYKHNGTVVSSIGLRMKYKPHEQILNTNETPEEKEDAVSYEQLEQLKSNFKEEHVKGRLQLVINHAKKLVSPDGSVKTAIRPYVKVSLDGWEQGLKTKEADSLNPVWKVSDFIDFDVKRKDLKNLIISVFTGKDVFLGECAIQMKDVLRYPGIWTINGLKDLTEREDRL
jgi:hypothetical protein